MEELSKRYEKLQLTEHEVGQVDLDNGEVAEGWVLAGKLL